MHIATKTKERQALRTASVVLNSNGVIPENSQTLKVDKNIRAGVINYKQAPGNILASIIVKIMK